MIRSPHMPLAYESEGIIFGYRRGGLPHACGLGDGRLRAAQDLLKTPETSNHRRA